MYFIKSFSLIIFPLPTFINTESSFIISNLSLFIIPKVSFVAGIVTTTTSQFLNTSSILSLAKHLSKYSLLWPVVLTPQTSTSNPCSLLAASVANVPVPINPIFLPLNSVIEKFIFHFLFICCSWNFLLFLYISNIDITIHSPIGIL